MSVNKNITVLEMSAWNQAPSSSNPAQSFYIPDTTNGTATFAYIGFVWGVNEAYSIHDAYMECGMAVTDTVGPTDLELHGCPTSHAHGQPAIWSSMIVNSQPWPLK